MLGSPLQSEQANLVVLTPPSSTKRNLDKTLTPSSMSRLGPGYQARLFEHNEDGLYLARNVSETINHCWHTDEFAEYQPVLQRLQRNMLGIEKV